MHSSTSTLSAHSDQRKIVLVPSLWSLKQHSRCAIEVHALCNGMDGVALQCLIIILSSNISGKKILKMLPSHIRTPLKVGFKMKLKKWQLALQQLRFLCTGGHQDNSLSPIFFRVCVSKWTTMCIKNCNIIILCLLHSFF